MPKTPLILLHGGLPPAPAAGRPLPSGTGTPPDPAPSTNGSAALQQALAAVSAFARLPAGRRGKGRFRI